MRDLVFVRGLRLARVVVKLTCDISPHPIMPTRTMGELAVLVDDISVYLLEISGTGFDNVHGECAKTICSIYVPPLDMSQRVRLGSGVVGTFPPTVINRHSPNWPY